MIGASPGVIIRGNMIGTDVTGAIDIGNGFAGVQTLSANTILGGTSPGDGNVISANGSLGIVIQAAGSTVQGNFIGTDITGMAALGNGFNGIRVEGIAGPSGVVIGGPTEAARNIISAIIGQGVRIGANDVVLERNHIGTDISGTLPLGNTQQGVLPECSGTSIIDNLISANAFTGIFIRRPTGVTVKGNYIGTD